jgi:hypothetical protein
MGFFTPYSRAGRVNAIRSASFCHSANQKRFWRDPEQRAKADRMAASLLMKSSEGCEHL